jgi:hypothetical protein
MFEEIVYILSCLRRYPRLYVDNQVLRDAMVDIFQSIMHFCSRARDLFRKEILEWCESIESSRPTRGLETHLEAIQDSIR